MMNRIKDVEPIASPSRIADGDLLAQFVTRRDDSAFAELVARHGRMVFGVCLRRLGQSADAEDAFQAVFLSLAKHAEGLASRTTVGPWLYTVVRQVTTKALQSRRRRRWLPWTLAPEPKTAEPLEVEVDLDAALASLSESERAAIVLCHLEGLSRSEAAKALGCPEGTLSARLSRGLEKLRKKLGKPPLAVLVAASLVMLPDKLPASTVDLVHHFRDGALDDWASPGTLDLFRKADPMRYLHRAGPIVASVMAVGLIAVGASFGWNLIQAQQDKPKKEKKAAGEPGGGSNPFGGSDEGGITDGTLEQAVKQFNEWAKSQEIGKTQPPSIEGEVMNVRDSGKFLEITLGENDGLRPGHRLYIFRRSPDLRFVGEGEVISTRPNRAVLRPTNNCLTPPKNGDRVGVIGSFGGRVDANNGGAGGMSGSPLGDDPALTLTAREDKVVSLADAVKQFNNWAQSQEIGKTQPPLTEDEVVASIRAWRGEEGGAGSTELYKAFQNIADTRTLPNAWSLNGSESWRFNNYHFDVWRIELSISTAPNKTARIVVRDQKIRVRIPGDVLITIPLKNSNAESTAEVLKKAIDGKWLETKVTADSRTNSLIILVPKAKEESIRKTVQALDELQK